MGLTAGGREAGLPADFVQPEPANKFAHKP